MGEVETCEEVGISEHENMHSAVVTERGGGKIGHRLRMGAGRGGGM